MTLYRSEAKLKEIKKFMKNFYKITAKCGHVGKKNYIPIKFAVCAEDGKEAAKKVRNFARVKDNHKDAILDVKSISIALASFNNINIFNSLS